MFHWQLVIADGHKQLVEKEKGVLFGGRLAEYHYYDMEQTISSVFDAWRQMG